MNSAAVFDPDGIIAKDKGFAQAKIMRRTRRCGHRITIPAEFEEKSYELPLYNQLERNNAVLFAPRQVLENTLGFDAGIFMANAALWETLGYKTPLRGAGRAGQLAAEPAGLCANQSIYDTF
jgi:hypothetical protein